MLARVLGELGRPDEALAELAIAERRFREASVSHLLVAAIAQRAELLSRAGRKHEAERAKAELDAARSEFGIAGPGRMPREVIALVLNGAKDRLMTCYEQGLARNPTLGGTVPISFDIGIDGSVSRVDATGGDMPDADVRACVLEVHRRLRFPKPEGGYVRVVRPLRFERSEATDAEERTKPKP